MRSKGCFIAMHRYLEIVRDFIIRQRLFSGDEKNILVGLSGGADSVCLLFMLKELKKNGMLPYTEIIAAHINHGIRGEEAKRDEQFVNELCKKHSIRLFCKTADIPKIAADTKESEESAGRRIRYSFFREVLGCEGGGVTVTAHHKNDLAETVLMNIARGTGLTGLSGIRAKQGEVARPLICLTRRQIEEYVRDNGLKFVNDSTNALDIYTRNYLRNKVIPLMEENVNTGLVEHIFRLSEISARADEYFEEEALRLFKQCASTGDKTELSCALISRQKRIVREYLYRRIFQKLTGFTTDFSAERIDETDALVIDTANNKRNGKIIELPHGIRVMAGSGSVYFIKAEALKINIRENEYEDDDDIEIALFEGDVRQRLEGGECVKLKHGGVEVLLELTEIFLKNEDSCYTKFFNYDIISDTACLRRVQRSDFITVTADGKKHSVMKELKNRKIPAKDRDKTLVLVQGSDCLWIPGVRRSMKALAGGEGRILKISVHGCTKGN